MNCCLLPDILIESLTGALMKGRRDFWKRCGKFECVIGKLKNRQK